jgi:hypothetical protein
MDEIPFDGAHILEVYELSSKVTQTDLETVLKPIQEGLSVPPVIR